MVYQAAGPLDFLACLSIITANSFLPRSNFHSFFSQRLLIGPFIRYWNSSSALSRTQFS